MMMGWDQFLLWTAKMMIDRAILGEDTCWGLGELTMNKHLRLWNDPDREEHISLTSLVREDPNFMSLIFIIVSE